VDFEAGLEHLGRGTAKGIDVMIVVTEPSQKSLDLCHKIIELSKKLGVVNIFLVANKVINDKQIEKINERVREWQIPLYHSLPYDSEIGNADLNGISPIDYNPESDAMKSLKVLYLKLKALKKELFDL
ncbi:MAG: carbon monoxide dehydrogenase, partial [Candidatus Lokiarchaeota archaeon]|nr:carbon monoxide dehydrogenase [Candidatus Lokiarchaeota archaeon]